MSKQQKSKFCKKCGEPKPLSKRGYCRQCAYEIMQEANRQMRAKQGPYYERWKASLIASVEGGD